MESYLFQGDSVARIESPLRYSCARFFGLIFFGPCSYQILVLKWVCFLFRFRKDIQCVRDLIRCGENCVNYETYSPWGGGALGRSYVQALRKRARCRRRTHVGQPVRGGSRKNFCPPSSALIVNAEGGGGGYRGGKWQNKMGEKHKTEQVRTWEGMVFSRSLG
jgi:hypothetical protein